GCQDINECEDSSKYLCYGKCINKPGGYDCFCPCGYPRKCFYWTMLEFLYLAYLWYSLSVNKEVTF
ncbi:hypothetical protein EE612_023366, partial [Oryza sativa]